MYYVFPVLIFVVIEKKKSFRHDIGTSDGHFENREKFNISVRVAALVSRIIYVGKIACLVKILR